jgi:hypothetical protein
MILSHKPPLPKQAKIAMCAAVVFVVGAAVLVGVYVATSEPAPAPLSAGSYAAR